MHRHFSEALNKELDNMGVPEYMPERVEIFAKLIKVPRFKAEAMLNGSFYPDEELLDCIVKELEIDRNLLTE